MLELSAIFCCHDYITYGCIIKYEVFVFLVLPYSNSFVPNCRDDCKLQILGKTPQVHLIIVKEWPKNNPLPPIYKILIIFFLVYFIRPTLQLGTKEYCCLRAVARKYLHSLRILEYTEQEKLHTHGCYKNLKLLWIFNSFKVSVPI